MDSGQPEGYNRAVHITYRHRMITEATVFACLALGGTIFAQRSAAQNNSSATPPQPGQITGHVYRADNNEPVSRAVVSLNPQGSRAVPVTGSPQSTRTDTNGAYTFASVTPGNYTLAAQHSGYINEAFVRAINGTSPEPFTVTAGETLSKIDVRLLPAAVISGTVLDEDNQPMEGAQVAAIRMRYQKGGQQQEMPMQQVTSDDLGNFRLYGLAEGNYFVRVEGRNPNLPTGEASFRSSYYPGTSTIESAQRLKAAAGAETSGVRFSVGTQSTYTITGTVIDTTDLPGPRRYSVSAVHTSEGGNFAVGSQASTDGTYTIRGVPSGDYLLTARAMQTGPPPQTAGPNGTITMTLRQYSGTAMVRVADNDAHANIQIGPTAEVDGKIAIENSTGQSISGIRVNLQMQTPGAGNGAGNSTAPADQNGVFKFQNLQTGSYFFSVAGRTDVYLKQAVCNGRDYTFQPMTVDSGMTIADCSLTLATDTAVMKGQVYDSDKPVPNLVVVAIPQSMALRRIARYTVTANTDANGAFQISGMVPGDYLVFAVPKDDEQSYFQIDFADRNQRDAERVSVKSGDAKTVTLKPATSQ
jgi:protocatechuate 3,4-dioxygenase beta subunit